MLEERKKKRRKQIQVDELVIKADKVILVDKDDDREKEPHREAPTRYVRDPWGFFFPRRPEEPELQNVEEEKKEDLHEGQEEVEEQKEDEQPRGWSWI